MWNAAMPLFWRAASMMRVTGGCVAKRTATYSSTLRTFYEPPHPPEQTRTRRIERNAICPPHQQPYESKEPMMTTILACKSAIAAREAASLASGAVKCAAARHASTLMGWSMGRQHLTTKKDIRHVNENPAVGRVVPAASAAAMMSTESHRQYTPPDAVLEWEKLATKELGRSKTGQTVESLRTSRTTPEGIAVQPVYYDLDSDVPEMPGVYPYTRGPYATMYTVRPWTVRQ